MLLNTIKLKIKTRDITYSQQTLTTGSIGMKAVFSFSPDWQDLTKIVVFRVEDEQYEIELEGDELIIPKEVFDIENLDKDLEVGVFGYDVETKELVIPTVYQYIGIIELGTKPDELSIWAPVVGYGAVDYATLTE